MRTAMRVQEAASSEHWRRCSWDLADVALMGFVALIALVAHPDRAIFSHPYWNDEAWVAVLTRVPWWRVPSLSSSTPFGWVWLLRLVPGSGLQRARAVPLLFSMLSAVAAYAFARDFAWPGRRFAQVAALWVGVVVALVPIALLRNDLKQYTADAFFALVLLTVARAVDHAVDVHAIRWFGVAAVVAAPFSTTSMFVSVACFAGLLGAALRRRDAARVRIVIMAGVAVAACFALISAAFVLPHVNHALHAYWQASYLHGWPTTWLADSWGRLSDIAPGLTVPAIVFVALFVIAIVMLARRREDAVVFAAVALWCEMFALGVLHRYPFLDRRTSHFLLIVTVAVIALALVEIAFRLARVHLAVAALFVALVVLSFGGGVRRFWHGLDIPDEDVRTPTLFVASHYQPGDVVLVSSSASWGFAFYWRRGHVATVNSPGVANGFVAKVSAVDAVYAVGRNERVILPAVREAMRRLRANGPGSTLYVIRTHLARQERTAWQEAFAAVGVDPHPMTGGREPLLALAGG